MSGGGNWPLIALEIALGFLVPLAWAVWQLIDLRRYRDPPRDDDGTSSEHGARSSSDQRGGRTRRSTEREAAAPLRPDAASETAAAPVPSDGRSGPGPDSPAR